LHQRTLLSMESIGNPHARCVLNGITLYNDATFLKDGIVTKVVQVVTSFSQRKMYVS